MIGLSLVLVIISLLNTVVDGNTKPNILLIIADDLGWDDIGFHGSPQAKTPTIDKLAKSGVILTDYYVQPICTPTRSAIMTGKYPIRNGMQSSVIMTSQSWGLGTDETLLPERLKKVGYKTHLVGKWHLGFFSEEYLPTRRGFDTFYGMYAGRGDYLNYQSEDGDYMGLDLRDGDRPVFNHSSKYSTLEMSAQASTVIANHDKSSPMFMMLSYLAIHSANRNDPLQAPKEDMLKFSHIQSENRKKVLAMASAMDRGIAQVYEALDKNNMLDNTIIIFTTDNGAASNGFDMNYGSNFPLRGIKTSLFEGGVRAAGFVHSKLIKTKSRMFTGLVHATDWFSTILGLADANSSDIGPVDGKDLWDSISTDKESPREEILLNIDEMIYNNAAIRVAEWKFVIQKDDEWDDWFTPPNSDEEYEAMIRDGKGTLKCKERPQTKPSCKDGCLFQITTDPCEYNDLSQTHPHVRKRIKSRLSKYRTEMVQPRYNSEVGTECDPEKHGGAWTPWEQENKSGFINQTLSSYKKVTPHADRLSLNQRNPKSHYLFDY